MLLLAIFGNQLGLFYIFTQMHFLVTYFDFTKSISFSKATDNLVFMANFLKCYAFYFYLNFQKHFWFF